MSSKLHLKPHQFCNYCGVEYSQLVWPRECQKCSSITWRNPLPVVVVMIPVYDKEPALGSCGVVGIRRNIPPDVGGLALVSGYVDDMEHWKEAAVREVKEETTLEISQEGLSLVSVELSSSKRHTLIFCKSESILSEEVPNTSNEEVQEVVVVRNPNDFAWETHQEMSRKIHAHW